MKRDIKRNETQKWKPTKQCIEFFFVVVCATKTYLLSFLHVISISFIQLGFHFSTFLSNQPLHNSLDVAHKFDNLQWWKIFFFSLPQTNQKILNIHIFHYFVAILHVKFWIKFQFDIIIVKWGGGKGTRHKWLMRLF